MDEGCESHLAALGKKIKARRKEGGSSLRDVVAVHGCNDNQWRRYEPGGGLALSFSFLVKVAVILQTTPSARARSAKELPAVWLQASFLQLI